MDTEKLQWLGRISGIAAWFCITYALWVISEGGTATGLLIFGIILAGCAMLCFLKAKRPRPE
jgi:hypothetical protein